MDLRGRKKDLEGILVVTRRRASDRLTLADLFHPSFAVTRREKNVQRGALLAVQWRTWKTQVLSCNTKERLDVL